MNIVSCCNFTEAKIGEVCTGQETISQKLNNSCKKEINKKKNRSIWPLKTLKIVHLEYRSSLLVARLVSYWFKVYKV